jgi:two-component system, NarL family, sensor kinase
LKNMAARAKKLGGQLSVRSRLGHGTKIIAEFALEPVLAPL